MYYNLINLIKINIKYKNRLFKIKLNKNETKLLKIFLKLNIIKYAKIEKNNVYIYINYNSNKCVNLINLYKPGHHLSISAKIIKRITYKNKWIFIISTNNGILTNLEAVKKNIGGVLICKIFN